MGKFKKEAIVLTSIVSVGILIRFLFLWLGRPEFVGWFNHTYYYYVETKGLLTNGKLPFPDMPLLFYLYAFTAKAISLFGIEQNTAIVSATRLWMCIVPSLIPVPIYLTIKRIVESQPLGWKNWLVIGASVLLPLTLLHLPEFSQKNMLGILLLAFFMFYAKTLTEHFTTKRLMVLIGLLVMITLTHFGSSGVAILFCISLLFSWVLHYKKPKDLLKVGLVTVFAIVFIFLLIYLIDVQRYNRIFYYFKESFPNSLVGAIFAGETNINERLVAFATIIVPILVVLFFFNVYQRNKDSVSSSDKVFWLGCIVFSYLLLLPVYDQLLMARFSLFLGLPLAFVLVYSINYSRWKIWVEKAVSTAIIVAVLVLGFGEFMSLKMHNRNKEAVFVDLMALKETVEFHSNDLILTKNGAEHICNWFLGTKSGLITSFNKNDFNNFGRVFILNPIERQLNFTDLEHKKADNEKDRYLFMMRNIPRPQNADEIYVSANLEFLEIKTPPQEWEYNSNGYWLSYGEN